jgi:hypothetical protein
VAVEKPSAPVPRNRRPRIAQSRRPHAPKSP